MRAQLADQLLRGAMIALEIAPDPDKEQAMIAQYRELGLTIAKSSGLVDAAKEVAKPTP